MHQNTQKLLDRMNAIGMRQDFFVDEEKAEECIGKIYDLHNLIRPNINWVLDITDSRLLDAIGWASRVSGERASRASRASGVSGASWASGASGVSWESRASRASWASGASGASGVSGASCDYDFDYFLDSYDWLQTNKGNKNDNKFIQSMFLFLEAKENGCGYFSEFEGIGYIAPRCVIKLDENYRYHSETMPSIMWGKGLEVYFLNGIKLEKDLWQSIVSKTISAKDALALGNAEHRALAMKYLGFEKLKEESSAKQVGKDQYGEIVELDIKDINNDPIRYFIGIDPSKGEPCYLLAPPDVNSPKEFLKQSYHLEKFNLDYSPLFRT